MEFLKDQTEHFQQLRHTGDVIRVLTPPHRIPMQIDQLICYKLPTTMKQEPVHDIFESIPKYKVNKRFYTGKELDIEDTVQLFADNMHLYIKTHFVNTKGFGESMCKKHILLFKTIEKDHGLEDLYTIEVNFQSEKQVNIQYGQIGQRNKPVQKVSDVDMQIYKSTGGFTAVCSFPFRTICEKLEDLQFNMIRVDWGAQPLTSLIPVGNSNFNESSKSGVHLFIQIESQGRMSQIQPVDQPDAHSKNKPCINMEYGKDNRIHLTACNGTFDENFVWITPDGKEFKIESTMNRAGSKTTFAFFVPNLSQEGLYRISLSSKHTYYFEKRDVIEASYFPLNEESDKASVDIELISDRAKKMLDAVPLYSGLENISDPKDTTLRPYELYQYDLENPHKIFSIKTNEPYPNGHYPENDKTVFDNGTGELIEYPYHKDQSFYYYFTPVLWAKQKKYICTHIKELAENDPVGAALVLEKMASCYPNYAPALDYYYINYPVSKAVGPPYPYFGGLWSRWFYHELNLVAGLAEGYSIINKTDVFEKLEENYKKDFRNKILFMIKDSIDFVDSYGIINGNMDTAVWSGLIKIGKALNRYDYIYDVLERIHEFVRVNFMPDGFWKETTLSYHNNVTQGIVRILDMIKEISIPEDFVYPCRANLDCTDPFVNYPIIQKAMNISKQAQYPNRKYIPIQDTHLTVVHEESELIYENILLPSAKVVRLAGPGREHQTQVVFLANAKYGHCHHNALNFNLFSKGVEMIPDYGYTHTSNRYWTLCTLGHNTVLVDGKDSANPKGGDLLQYIPAGDGTIGLVRGIDRNCYTDASIYDRQIITVPKETGEIGYVVDLFRLEGGCRHEYSLNFCADFDTTLTCSIPLNQHQDTMLPDGVEYEKPTTESGRGTAQGHYTGYMFVQNVKFDEIHNQPYKVSYDIKNQDHTGKGLYVYGTSCDGTLMLGRAPSMRETRISFAYDLNDRKDSSMLDKYIIRREGTNLKSVFIHVIEPFENHKESSIKQIEKIFLDPANEKDVLIKVTCEEYTDYVFSAYDTMHFQYNGIDFNGAFGFIRIKDQQAILIQTLQGRISYGEFQSPQDNSIEGVIQKSLSRSIGDDINGFIVKDSIDQSLVGKTILVQHPDLTTHIYTIQDVGREDGNTIIDTGDMDPGFTMSNDTKSKMHFFPFYEWEGITKYKIHDGCFMKVN